MKVLIATTEFPPQPGGVASLAWEQAAGLANLGAKVRVLAVGGRAEDAARQRFEIVGFQTSTRNILRLAPLTVKLLSQVREFRPDMVWVPTYRGFGLPAMLCCAAAKIPYGVYFHGTEIQTELRSAARLGILRKVVRSANLITTNSRNTAGLLNEKVTPVGAEVITPGVDTSRFADDSEVAVARTVRAQWLAHASAASAEPVVLLSMCRLTRGKGLHLVIEALAKLAHRRPELHWMYVIAGTGAEATALQSQVAAAGLQSRVNFIGPVPYQENTSRFLAADIYVQPSQPHGDFLESFGISFLEAQAAGLPCIGSMWGGVPEAVNNGISALLVPIGDIPALEQAIESLVSDSVRRQQFSTQGKAYAAQHTWQRHAEKLHNVLERVINSPTQ